MQAITTKYLPATNTKGARIKASCEAGSVTISYPHEAQHGCEAHAQAVYELGSKLRWERYMSPGWVAPGSPPRRPIIGIEFAPGEWVFLPEGYEERA